MGGIVRARVVLCVGAASLVLGACGSSSSSASVGDCIDASKNVVDCSSSDAKQKLVSDLNAPDATACIVIGDKPEVQVKVGDGDFCAEPK